MTQTITSLPQWRHIRQHNHSMTLGFVPTMGGLHAGHQALIEAAQHDCDRVVVSCFINPTQFNSAEDYQNYPHQPELDQQLLQEWGVDYHLALSVETLYPDGQDWSITEQQISQHSEGIHRPGHFSGVLTVMLKWLMLVQAQRVYMGEKDYQQYLLIDRLTQAFFIPTQVIPCPTVREPSGLALSTRNHRLSQAKRQLASQLYTHMKQCTTADEVITQLTQQGIAVDYVNDHAGRRYLAAWIDGVRLIDNLELPSC